MPQDVFGNYVTGLNSEGIVVPATGNAGGGSGSTVLVVGNPEGAESAEAPAIAYDADGRVYIKTGSGATGWSQIIGAPI